LAEDFEGEEPAATRDEAVDRAKEAIRALFRESPSEVFYQQQLCVLVEDEFFHWVTVGALNELAEEGRLLRTEVLMPSGHYPLRVYRLPSHRNWKRQGQRLVEEVAHYSSPDFARAVGRQGEVMFDAAFPRFGFAPRGKDVREWQGRRWVHTEHDLDRVFEADGRFYGVEIKNTLKYIPRSEMEIKVAMCRFFGVIPLFVMRFAPKVYTYEIFRAGGFSLLFKDQLYPFGNERLADRVRMALRLPVHCPASVPDGHMQRFVGWHRKQVRPVENADSGPKQQNE
jgi:hypothetical protein